jgi:hypothetical protein
MPYRTYSTIEDFFKDWKVLEVWKIKIKNW